MTTITSLANPKIKELVQLKKASHRRQSQLFTIDGLREILAAQKAGVNLIELYYCPTLIKKWPKDQTFGLNDKKIVEVSETVFQKICYKEKSDGFLAVAEYKSLTLDQIKVSAQPLIVVLESVEKPGNLGAILRTAHAAQVDAIIINENQTDIYNPNIIRASEGCLFSQQVVIASTEETISWLQANKIKSLAAATKAIKSYTTIDLKKAIAIILGSESEGLSNNWLKKADGLIKIPMKSDIDSLNVSVSAAIIIFETLRQRDLL